MLKLTCLFCKRNSNEKETFHLLDFSIIKVFRVFPKIEDAEKAMILGTIISCSRCYSEEISPLIEKIESITGVKNKQ